MPELPEVVTVSKILDKGLKNKVVKNINLFYPKLLKECTIDEIKNSILNKKLISVDNEAKYIIFSFGDYVLISHLRMEGKWSVETREHHSFDIKHLELEIEFDGGTFARYYDTRKFGTLNLRLGKDFKNQLPILKLGVDVTKNNINPIDLKNKLKNSKKPIKTTLLDQGIIAGIGNIYANEILFASKINPWKKSCDLSLEECKSVIDNTKLIFLKSIEYGGTTIHSFKSSENTSGNYQQFLKVHGLVGKHCQICNTIIEKDFLGGRGTYFCPQCQK